MTPPSDLQSLYAYLKQALKRHGVSNFEYEARFILQTRAGFDFGDFVTRSAEILPPEILHAIESDLLQRLSGKPLTRIYGVRQFWGLDFELGPHTLDPRPDTETLVEQALKSAAGNPPLRFLDLGTGTGCITAALLKEWPDSHGFAVDFSFDALQVAQRNFARHGLQGRAHLICGDWLSAISGRFDLVVSNPPYITNQALKTLSPEVVNHDPILALAGGENGLQAYKSIFLNLMSVLTPCGKALFEIGFDQADDVTRLAEESRFSVAGVHSDLAGQARVVEIICGDK